MIFDKPPKEVTCKMILITWRKVGKLKADVEDTSLKVVYNLDFNMQSRG